MLLHRLYWQCCSHTVYAFGQAVLAMLQPFSLCFWTGCFGHVAAIKCMLLDRQCCSHIFYASIQAVLAMVLPYMVHAFGQAVLAMLQPYSLCFYTGCFGHFAAGCYVRFKPCRSSWPCVVHISEYD